MYETPAAVPPPAPAKKKRNTGLVVVLVAVSAVLAMCVGGTVIAAVAGIDEVSKVTAGPTTDVRQPAAATTTAPAPPAVKPKPTDFQIAVKVIKKSCFGSAGCNVTFRIDITYTGPKLPPSKTYEVVYEVKGGENPLTNRFEVTGDTASYQEDEFIQTKSANAVLTAVATEVNELGR